VAKKITDFNLPRVARKASQPWAILSNPFWGNEIEAKPSVAVEVAAFARMRMVGIVRILAKQLRHTGRNGGGWGCKTRLRVIKNDQIVSKSLIQVEPRPNDAEELFKTCPKMPKSSQGVFPRSGATNRANRQLDQALG
jgi:hypothetical protein